METTDTLKQHKEGEGEGETVVDVVAHREGWEAGEDVREEELRGRDLKEEMESTGESVAEREMGKKVEGVKGDVERVVEEVRGEVERVAGEARDEKVREVQEMQMADQQLSWLKDSAQVSLISYFNCVVVGILVIIILCFRLRKSWSKPCRSLSPRRPKWSRHR